MRVDYDRRTLTCSVGDLIQEATHRRVGLERGDGFRRMWLGQQVHTDRANVRTAEDPFYRSEVGVSWETTVGDWTVRVSGRIDGLSKDPDEGLVVIEEVKSLVFSRELLALRKSDKLQRHLFQLMLYAFFLSKTEEYAGCWFRPQLVLIDLTSGATEVIEAPYEEVEVASAFEATVSRIIDGLETDRTLLIAKRSYAEDLEFPFASKRRYQQEMIDAVAHAAKEGEALLVNAPTGIGKTIAAIYPALRESLSQGRKLFYLTSKTLQQQIAVETLALMNDGSFRTLRIRAKRKMCANDEVICHEDFCRYAARYGEKMEKHALVPTIVDQMSYFDPDEIFERAKTIQVCPFEVTLELVEEADVVVCDYNYIFDPWIGLSSYRGENDYSNCILIVDEAHNLLDRARGYFSPEIEERTFEEIELHLASRPGCSLHGWDDLIGEMRGHLRELAQVFSEEQPVDGFQRDGRIGQALCEPDLHLFERHRADWEQLILQYIDWKIENRVAEENDPLMDFYFRLVRFTQLLAKDGDEFARIIERTPKGLRLKIFCKDPSPHLAEVFDSAHATIAFSATLEPFDFHRTTLGFPGDRSAAVSLPSPFPRDNRKIVVVPSVETTWKKRSSNYEPIATKIAEISDPSEGNFLVLFPSYAFLAEVEQRLPRLSKKILVQRTDMTDYERRALLDMLRDNPSPGNVVLAVSGGMYAEGIDYQGDMLSGVIVVGPALPSVTFEQELLKRYYDERYGEGFEYAYLIPGMTRVIQSAGRVIRSETDVGVIALLCRRFTMSNYNRYFPSDWYEESPRELVSRQPGEVIREFFEKKKGGNLTLF